MISSCVLKQITSEGLYILIFSGGVMCEKEKNKKSIILIGIDNAFLLVRLLPRLDGSLHLA